MFYLIMYICIFFFVLIVAGTAWFVWQYRYRPGVGAQPSPTHNHTIEVLWTGIPLLIVIWMFWAGFKGYSDLTTPPNDAYEIIVGAQKWQWDFTYPNGLNTPIDVRVPAGRNVVFTMTSKDVLHAMYIPDFRVKQDVVPGRYSKVWFNAPEPGTHVLTCAEYCGKGHSDMHGTLTVMPPAEYDHWLATYNPVAGKTLVEAGEYWYNTRGCKQCHASTARPASARASRGSSAMRPSWLTAAPSRLTRTTCASRCSSRGQSGAGLPARDADLQGHG